MFQYRSLRESLEEPLTTLPLTSLTQPTVAESQSRHNDNPTDCEESHDVHIKDDISSTITPPSSQRSHRNHTIDDATQYRLEMKEYNKSGVCLFLIVWLLVCGAMIAIALLTTLGVNPYMLEHAVIDRDYASSNYCCVINTTLWTIPSDQACPRFGVPIDECIGIDIFYEVFANDNHNISSHATLHATTMWKQAVLAQHMATLQDARDWMHRTFPVELIEHCLLDATARQTCYVNIPKSEVMLTEPTTEHSTVGFAFVLIGIIIAGSCIVGSIAVFVAHLCSKPRRHDAAANMAT